MGLGNIAAPARTDRQRWPCTPRRREHQPMPDHRRRNDLEQVAGGVPELLSGARRVAVDHVLAADHDLVVVIHPDSDRRSPAGVLFSIRPPDSLASARIQRGDERADLRASLHVLIEDHAIAVQEDRAGRTVRGMDLAEVAVPDDLSLHVGSYQAMVTEVRIDALAVGSGCPRGMAVLLVHSLCRRSARRGSPPLGAVVAIKRQQRHPRTAIRCAGEENLIAPDDRRGVAAAGNGNFP